MSGSGSNQCKRLLLVEDHNSTRSALGLFLRSHGHTVVAYPSAEEAAAAFADRSLDLALIDIRLPGRPGDAYAADLHAHQPDLPIIFFTAESKTDHLIRLIPTSQVCQKPVSPSALLKVIESTRSAGRRHG